MTFLPFPALFSRNFVVSRRSRRYPIVVEGTHATSVCNADVWFAVGDENVVAVPGEPGTAFLPANTFLTTAVRKQSLSPPVPGEPAPPDLPPDITHFAVVSTSIFPLRKLLTVRVLDQFAGDVIDGI